MYVRPLLSVWTYLCQTRVPHMYVQSRIGVWTYICPKCRNSLNYFQQCPQTNILILQFLTNGSFKNLKKYLKCYINCEFLAVLFFPNSSISMTHYSSQPEGVMSHLVYNSLYYVCPGWTHECPGWTHKCPGWTNICPGWTNICPGWTYVYRFQQCYY